MLYQKLEKKLPVDHLFSILAHHPEATLHEVVSDMEEGIPVITMDCHLIMHVISKASKTHEIIYNTIVEVLQ